MLTYELKKPLYLSLYRHIKADILNHVIKANDKLPSKRKLANHLNISLITVENAYEQLLAEGYIFSIEKKGYFVENNDFSTNNALNKEVKKIKDYPIEKNKDSNNLFPYSTYLKLRRQIINERGTSLLDKGESIGELELRLAISNHLSQFRNLEVNPDNIIVGAGAEYLYNLLIQLLNSINHNLEVAIEDPGYYKIAKIYQSNRVNVNYLPLDSEGLSLEELKKSKANLLHISPNHQFPSGIIMPVNRRLALLNWAKKTNTYIIEDDFDAEFRFKGRPISTLKSLNQAKVIYLNTFTKTLSPSLRLAYMVLPENLMDIYHQNLAFYSSTVSRVEQLTIARFIDEAYFERHLNRLKKAYRIKRDYVIKAFDLAKFDYQILQEDAGLNFLLELNEKFDYNAIQNSFKRANIDIKFLNQYTIVNQSFKPILVINYLKIKSGTIKEMIQILNRFKKSL